MKNLSHFTSYKTELTGVTVKQAQEAIEELAKQIGATVITSMSSVFWDRQNIVAGLKTNDVPNGIGVRVEEGRLVICGDNWNQELGFAKMQKLITGYATVHKVKMNAKMYKLPTTVKIRDREILLEVG